MLNLGLKLGTKDTQYTDEILQYYEQGVFQYIELFTLTGTFDDTISYWKQFDIPFGIHAPHSAAGLNLANTSARVANKAKIAETIKFADELKARYIIFHSGTNGMPGEVIQQLSSFADERFCIENKPIRGLDGSTCVGSIYSDLKLIIDGIGKGTGFCLDFGHAICAARTLKKEPFDFINKLIKLNPRVYHLTDGDYSSELDSHLHYGDGSFPLKELLALVPDGGMITNEAKRFNADNLAEFAEDAKSLKQIVGEKLS
ncbi:MAG: sugar phosphate isomerase/epimerase family protein [Treponema sp.]